MIKQLLRRIADLLIVVPVRYIRSKSSSDSHIVSTRLDVLSTMHNNAVIDSANYAEKNMASAMAFEDKERMWAHVLDLCKVDGLYIEFGVWKGESINYFARRLKGREIYDLILCRPQATIGRRTAGQKVISHWTAVFPSSNPTSL